MHIYIYTHIYIICVYIYIFIHSLLSIQMLTKQNAVSAFHILFSVVCLCNTLIALWTDEGHVTLKVGSDCNDLWVKVGGNPVPWSRRPAGRRVIFLRNRLRNRGRRRRRRRRAGDNGDPFCDRNSTHRTRLDLQSARHTEALVFARHEHHTGRTVDAQRTRVLLHLHLLQLRQFHLSWKDYFIVFRELAALVEMPVLRLWRKAE